MHCCCIITCNFCPFLYSSLITRSGLFWLRNWLSAYTLNCKSIKRIYSINLGVPFTFLNLQFYAHLSFALNLFDNLFNWLNWFILHLYIILFNQLTINNIHLRRLIGKKKKDNSLSLHVYTLSWLSCISFTILFKQDFYV